MLGMKCTENLKCVCTESRIYNYQLYFHVVLQYYTRDFEGSLEGVGGVRG